MLIFFQDEREDDHDDNDYTEEEEHVNVSTYLDTQRQFI